MANNNNKILVGKIVAPQGIRGDVRVQTYSDKPSDFQQLKIESARFSPNDFEFVRVVPNSTVIIAHIAGIDNRNAAETLRGTELFVDRSSLPAPRDGEYYQADLIGFTVFRNNQQIGTVAGFQNFGAGDIIELDNGEYVSFIGANVDIDHKTIKVA